jgi:flagellin-like hook-associated protein FlgL
MPITLGSNISSMKAQRELSKGSDALSKVYQRLSSGLRINSASDDAAGLSVSSTLKADARVYAQGVRNLNDGISLFNIADGALNELNNIVMRISELATQAANGAYSNAQRNALDTEAQALAKEYFRISRTTTFNGLNLFNGSVDTIRLQSGYGNEGGISANLGGDLGTGTFNSATSYSTQSGASNEVRLADLNADGILDLISAGTGAGFQVQVRLGTGGGSFGAAVSYAAESAGSSALGLGDLNGDGILDLVTAGISGGLGYATVRLGTGSGSFGASTSYTTETNGSRSLSLVDLNGDSVLDLVTAGIAGANGYATVRLGTGSGSFGAATSFITETSGSSNSLSLGDLNGDGVLDMVTAGSSLGSGYSTVRLGTGTGSFGAATSFATESTLSYGVSLGDLNGDNILDIVTAGNNFIDGYATVRLGTGTGSFGAATSFATETDSSYGLSLGDINGDGHLDLVTAGQAGTGTGAITVRLGTGSGSFGASISYASETNISYSVALGDLNRDGVLDVLTAGLSGVSGSANVRLGATEFGVAPLLSFSLKTATDASWAMSLMKQKLEQLAEQRSTIGAFQSRFDVAVRMLESTIGNFREAASRITDADLAEESAELVRRQILQQANAAVLAQANQQPALALKLLT